MAARRMSPDTTKKIEWLGEVEGEGGLTHVNVIWEQPDDLDWSKGYSASATYGDCDLIEDAVSQMYPDYLYVAHTGYAPEDRWPEEYVDRKLQKRAWYGSA